MIPGLEPGMLFGSRYEIIRCIGTGGMGAVYLACDPDYRDFLVALKILYPGIVKSNEARERFRTEIVASYRVNHKNIVRAFEYFDSEDAQAYAMEYIDGGDLGDLMEEFDQKDRMPIPDVIEILSQIAAGLDAIHKEGIVHRDLKPENILLAKDKTIKISDFGVARLRGSITLTAAGSMVGTPKYVSPEYVELGECDQRSDIYAAGIIGYEMIAGESPFKSESRLSIMMERFNFDARQLKNYAPDCPQDLIRVISKAMAVDVNDRYHSAGQMFHDLECIKNGKRPLYAKEIINNSAIQRKDNSRVPGIDDVALLSGLVQQNQVLSRFNQKRTVRRSVVLFSLALLSMIGLFTLVRYSGILGSDPLGSIKQGSYSGSISNLFDQNDYLPFELWRTKAGLFALVGKSHCLVAAVDKNSRFNCGDLTFVITAKKGAESGKLEGTIKETNLNLKGTWRVDRDVS